MEWLTLILSVLLGALGIYYIFVQKFDRLEKLGILHVKPSPIFGNMTQALFRRRTLGEVIDDAYKLNEEAQYTGLYDFSEPVIVIRSPELIKDIAVKYFDHFVDHRGFTNADLDPLFGSNLFSLRGDRWKDMRNLLSPAFTGSKMRQMFKLMLNCGKNFADYLAERSSNKPHVLNAKDAFLRYTNDVIATCAFGISIDSMKNPNNEFYVLGKKATNLEGILSLKFFLVRSFPNMAKFFNVKLVGSRIEKFFTEVVKETVETRVRKNITRPDMIQLMMDSREKKTGDGPNLSISDMTSQAFLFFFGGFDTSASLMSFAAHLLAVNKDIQKRLQDEVDNVMKTTNGDLTYDAINGMELLDAVLNETLRLYPISVFVDRMCVKTFELPPALPGGKPTTIEPGQNVWFPAYSIHRDPKYFDNPDKFDPDRFMGIGKNDIDPFTYFPFGMGPRMCIGNRFALLETKVVLFYLLSMCNLNPSDKMILPLEISRSSFVLSAQGGFWLELESRSRA